MAADRSYRLTALTETRAGVESLLTVMLVEDYVEGPQTGVTTPLEGEYVHRNVVRAVLTGVWGDPVGSAVSIKPYV